MLKVIQPNCRVQLTAQDVEFIVSVLGGGRSSRNCLVDLLADEDSRDLILDDEKLFRAVLEQRGCLRISTHLYFYVLVRRVFRGSGIEQRVVADYVAELLSDFSHAERMRAATPGLSSPPHSFVDLLAALQNADDVTRFFIRAHIGNASLFLAGVFPGHIRHRAERRGAPDLRYYEELGRTSFRAASDHRLARQYELSGVFSTLSEQFRVTRRALNDLSDRLLALGDVEVPFGPLNN
jgi:hypothetical protein